MTIPCDLEAEARILGGAMKSVNWANETFASLSTYHFYGPKNRLIFDLMHDLYKKDSELSIDTIDAHLPKEGLKIENVVEVYSLGNTSLFISEFIGIVKDCFLKRELHSMGIDLSAQTTAKGFTSSHIIRSFEEKLFSLTQDNKRKVLVPISEVIKHPKDYLKMVQERQEKFLRGESAFDGLPTHFNDLDAKLKGLVPGHFTIIGARPGVGKTTFVLNLIENLCFKSRAKCLFFSLEMPSREILEKLICQLVEVPFQKIALGQISSEEYQKIVVGCKAWADKTLIMDDQPSLAIDQLKSRAIRAKRIYNIDAIFVDYVQLITSKGQEARHLEIGDISRKCKEIAKELNVPLIALAQLNRDVEKRTDKKPFISDLRESGSLEADADEILLLHRPELYDSYEKPGLMEIHVAKNRFGPTGQFYLHFQKETGTLKNYVL